MAQLRLIHYPPQDRVVDDREIGVGTHTDYECFTILWQGSSGLQVRNPKGEWIEAPPIPGTFVINIGDMMQRWTNDLFVSTPHRVINTTGKARYSLPFFFGANYDAIIEPLACCVGPDNPPRYPPTKCGYWTEAMHTLAYAYRSDERGRTPNPELAAV
jgi:isopenicillin N synthase-like dioxygenase